MAELSTGGNQRDIERVSSSKDSIRGRVSADFLDQRFSISDEASFEGQVELPVLGTTVSRHCREIVRNYHDGDSIQYGRKVQLGVFLRTHATTLKGDFPEDEKSIACFILELAKVYPGSAAFKSLQLLTDDKEVARVITAYADQILARFKKESDLSKISLEKVVAAVIEYASKFGVKTEVGKESSLKEKLAELKKKENLKIILQQRGDGFYRRVNITYHGFNLVSEDDGVLLVSDDAVWKERQNRKNLGQAIGQHLNVFGKFEKIFVFVQLKRSATDPEYLDKFLAEITHFADAIKSRAGCDRVSLFIIDPRAEEHYLNIDWKRRKHSGRDAFAEGGSYLKTAI